MLSVASAITVPTASQKSRYSPKVCASRQRTSTTGSRNCSALSNALTAPSEKARRASPWAAIALAAAFIFPREKPGQKKRGLSLILVRCGSLSCELVEEPRVTREHFAGGMIALEVGEAIVARLSPKGTIGKQPLHPGGALRGVGEDG